MTTADVTFIIDADDTGLRSALKRSARDLKSFESELDELRRGARSADAEVRKLGGGLDDLDVGPADAGVKKFTLSAEKAGQALSIVNPRLGEMTAKIGGLGAAGGPLLAGGAAVTAFGVAWAGVVVHMVDAIRNIDDLTESLTEQQRLALDPYIDRIEAVRDVFDSIGASLTETQLRVLAGFADGISDVARAVDTLAGAFNRLDDSTSGKLSDFIGRLLSGQNPIAAAVASAALRPMEPATASVTAAPAPAPTASVTAAPAPAPTASVTAAPAPAPTASAAVAASSGAARMNRPPDDGFALFSEQWDAQFKAQQEAADESFRLFSEQWDAQVAYAEKSQAAIVEAGRQSVIAQAAQSEYLRELDKQRQAGRVNREQQASAAIEDLVIGSAGVAIGAMGDMLSAQARTAREQWEIQQATALATALINIPLSILSGLAEGGPVLAAVNGVLAGAQFAAIAATRPPQFHTGGYAPDEMVIRDNERTAVITPAGQEYLTPSRLAEINAGAANHEPAQVWMVLDGVPYRTRRFATNPQLGYASAGVRRG